MSAIHGLKEYLMYNMSGGTVNNAVYSHVSFPSI